MKKVLLLILLGLFTLTVYSQENDDVYWTMYDADTIEEDSNTYHTDYTSRINRFHRRPYYASYWSYYNPYWYSYYNPFYTSSYWWYSPFWGYYGWNHHNHHHHSHWYSYYPTYHYTHNHHNNHYGPHYKKPNNPKKQIVYNPKKVYNTKPHTVYHRPKSTVKTYPTYQKPKSVKYNHSQKNTYIKPKSIQRPIRTSPQKIQHTRPVGVRKPR